MREPVLKLVLLDPHPSEFGLGMKAAACWFAQNWSVRTTAIDDPFERTISFDIPKITSKGIEQLHIQEKAAPAHIHYTVIQLNNLRVKPRGRTIRKIRDHLASIYRVLLTDNTLSLTLTTTSQGAEPLGFSIPPLLRAPFFKTPRGKQVEWRKEFEFEMAPGKTVKGWAGLLNRGSSSKAGFSIFRRRRLIEGSIDKAYKPKEIFRAPNSFTYQRLTGEIHVSGFDVSHTKDGIQWGGLEDEMIQQLKLELNADPLPLLKQAEGHRSRRRGSDMKPGFGKKAIESIATVLQTDATAKLISEQTKEIREAPVNQTTSPSVTTRSVTKHTVVIRIPGEPKPWTVELELISDPTKEWYDVGTADNRSERKLSVTINLAHPFSEHFINDNEAVLPPVLRLVAGLMLAEHNARVAGQAYAGTLRRNLNNLLRGSLGSADSKAPK